jgi:hypothetical protein
MFFALNYFYFEARSSAVVWSAVLQVGRSRVRFPMVSMEFFIYIILLATLESTQPLREMSIRNIYLGEEAVTFMCRLSCNLVTSDSSNPQGLYRDYLILLLLYFHNKRQLSYLYKILMRTLTIIHVCLVVFRNLRTSFASVHILFSCVILCQSEKLDFFISKDERAVTKSAVLPVQWVSKQITDEIILLSRKWPTTNETGLSTFHAAVSLLMC